ncbi:hypothetical protein [Geomesophilobacter sediminis]|uniref:YtkA-like domain-containing protein n=1 Tax=Geomesophilobacter sediminis TaxID=2798584 RepID=A0A8J7IZR4_9BACT|nr:hypothetical protein [Geomesophilobacter sediminis]MBJ6723613.1 hypothetical protein [Geomesophilobacter sediminis]
MNKFIVLVAAALAFSAPLAAQAMDHEHMDHGSHGMADHGNVAHEEVVSGVKATFKIIPWKERQPGMMETHHVMVEFKDAKTGQPLTQGQVLVKIQAPDKSIQTKELMGMQNHFGADFDLSQKGKYGIMSKFKLKDGKEGSAKFWYPVK